MTIETIKTTDLSPDPANARKHGERNLDAIKSSLRRFGQQKPIVIDTNGIVRAGNGTLAAAVALGWKEIACIRSELPLSELAAYAVADNRTAELAEWNADGLAAVLDGLDDIGLRNLAFDDPEELAKLLDRPQFQEPGENEAILDQFEVVVTCRDEAHQREVFNRLTETGESCRLLTL